MTAIGGARGDAARPPVVLRRWASLRGEEGTEAAIPQVCSREFTAVGNCSELLKTEAPLCPPTPLVALNGVAAAPRRAAAVLVVVGGGGRQPVVFIRTFGATAMPTVLITLLLVVPIIICCVLVGAFGGGVWPLAA